jgi:hypothetical protein
MSPDDMKQAWQAQASPTRHAIDPDLLLTEFRRNHLAFTAMIFCRDLREVGVSLLLIPVWIWLGTRQQSPWTWYLAIPALLWIAGFMLVDRRRHSRRAAPEEPLRQQVEVSLAQVEHQIWLLRNVLWWYVLPLALPILAFFLHVSWREFGGGWLSILPAVVPFVITIGVFAFVYRLNQHAVRVTLEPRRRELQALVEALNVEAIPAD